MAIELEPADQPPHRGNQEANDLQTALERAGVLGVGRKKTQSGTLDAGSIVEIISAATPVALVIAHGIAAYLRPKPGIDVNVRGTRGRVRIRNAESKDIPAIAEKLDKIL